MAVRISVSGPIGRAVSGCALVLSLAGCAAMGDVSATATDTDIGKVGVLLFHSIAGIGSANEVPRERVVGIPYASLGARLGSSDESLLVLAGKSGDNLLWLGGKRLAITTRHGRIVQTVGFARNLSGVEPAPTPDGNADTSGGSYLYDFAEQVRYGIRVTCEKADLGPERIVIIGVPHDTDHVAEDCSAPQIDWRFRNEFWNDSSGFVWKSRQYVQPDLDAFSLEVLRPAQ